MKTYTITNTFHNTFASFLSADFFETAHQAYLDLVDKEWSLNKDDQEYKLVSAKLKRIEKKLCGNNKCLCNAMIKSA